VARPELGSKHHCEHCGARFFDLNRSPIACPKCGTVVEGVPRAVPHAAEADEKDLSAGAETELVSLEEADVEEGKVAAAADDEGRNRYKRPSTRAAGAKNFRRRSGVGRRSPIPGVADTASAQPA
jgi:uncharacterized protein (TIGR02300 family)